MSGLRCLLNWTLRSEVDDDVHKKRKRHYAHQVHLRVMSSVECQVGWRHCCVVGREWGWQRQWDNDEVLCCSIKDGCQVWKYVYRQLRDNQTCADAAQPGGGGGFILGMLLPRGCLLRIWGCLSTAVWPIFDEMSVMDASIAIKYLVNVQDPKLNLSPKKNQSHCSTHQGLHNLTLLKPFQISQVVYHVWMATSIFRSSSSSGPRWWWFSHMPQEKVVSANGADVDAGEQARNAWVKLCVDLLRVQWWCDVDILEVRKMGCSWGCGCGVGSLCVQCGGCV